MYIKSHFTSLHFTSISLPFHFITYSPGGGMPLGGEPYPKAEAPSLVNEPQHMRGNQMNRRKNNGMK
jgi:hypothetical protein